ncbi:hypothetical protein [Aureliella helgolandensis]|uniref:Uncharacterized protein n=1 Tax=Aureliella helgolandensis TaxID=2527968 RepID=A0A518G709_9BACT|nr:hypothetical protein [Aureliella helgolandensis]QDV24366.1 hypothetical protein Q31a_26830 [Aureliella helgolandensis]
MSRKEAGSQAAESDNELHFSFVELLFSLAVAEIALRFADVVDNAGPKFLEAECWPAYCHLLLALLLITTSWIGWGKASRARRNIHLSSVYSPDFAELMIDVFLVVVYFVLVRKTETVDADLNVNLSMRPEAVCLAAVFILYFMWDFISKFPLRMSRDGTPYGWKPILTRGKTSLTCALLALIAAVYSWHVATSVYQVIAFDLSAMGLIILFRELKEAGSHCPVGWQWWRVIVSAAIYAIPIALIRYIP